MTANSELRGVDQEGSTARTEAPRDATVFAINNVVAEIARAAHYLLGSGFDGMTKAETARHLAQSARKLNGLAHRPYSDADMAILLGRAAELQPRRLGMVIRSATEAAAGSVVLAVDPSRSTPDEALAPPAPSAPRETPT